NSQVRPLTKLNRVADCLSFRSFQRHRETKATSPPEPGPDQFRARRQEYALPPCSLSTKLFREPLPAFQTATGNAATA
ncbi:MAG: hypothetical protein AAGF59_16055, partial [Pseudomonadota bacterium]